MSKYDGTWTNDPLDIRCIRLDAELEALSEARHKRKGKPRRLPRSWQPKTLSELFQYCKEDDSWDLYCSRTIPKAQLLTWEYAACDIIRKSDGKILDNTCSSIDQAMQRITDEHNGEFDKYDIYWVRSYPKAEVIKVEL